MNEIFGASMTVIAAVCAAITLLIFVAIAYIAWRNPVMFKMGLRNIPRRKAQTALIIVGLMLSTLIMTAAFGTGDTLTTSVTAEVYDVLGEADEVISWDSEKQPAPVDAQVIPLAEVDEWQAMFAKDPEIEAFVPFQDEVIPLQNTRSQLNEAAARIVAFRPADAEVLGGLKDLDGNAITLADNEIAINEDLQEALDAQVGDPLVAFYENQQVQFTVKAIVPSDVLGGNFGSGVPEGARVNFDVLAEITGQGPNADGVFVSNAGDAHGGLDLSDSVTQKLDDVVAGTPYKVEPLKADAIQFAELFGSIFTTIFIVFGLFSIAAGVLLIFLIFVMLAAERKPEMGMARAIGTKRRQLVESFLAEGMGYDLGSAVVGLVAGMLVTVAMVQVISATAGESFGLEFTVAFTPRSTITAFCIGVIATFIVIFVSSWRASRLNITAAIRDLPDTKPVNPEAGTWRGYYRGALNGVVALMLPIGVALTLVGSVFLLVGGLATLVGLITPWFYVLRGSNFAAPRAERTDEGLPSWPWITGLAIPVIGWFLILPWYFIAVLLVWLTRDRKPSAIPGWLPAAGIVVPPVGFVFTLLQDVKTPILWNVGWAVGLGYAGIALTIVGLDSDTQFPFFLGFSLLFLWAAVTLEYFGVSERLAYTATSALLLVGWYLPTSAWEKVAGELSGDIEMLFLSGMVMVTAATFIVVYNADIILPLFAGLGARFGRIVPALKTAVAYPLTSRFRTGMTMAMIGLIMFSLVMMATINRNFAAVFLNDDTKGGWDVVAAVNANNPVESIVEALGSNGGPDTSAITETGELRIAYPFEVEVENIDQVEDDGVVEPFLSYPVFGGDDAFLAGLQMPFRHRAAGYETDEAVWEAMAADPTLAVINAAATAPPDPFNPDAGDQFRLDDQLPDGFEPFTLNLRDPDTGAETEITIIGQMEEAADVFLLLGDTSLFSGGILTSKETLLEAFPASQGQRFYLDLEEGVDSEEYAKQVEATLVQASAESLQQLLDEQQELQNGFLLVFQGFMGLGLIVGIAALAVVASRAVVERRQQIGMLRAIGYQRSMVALSFLFESGFIALSGILLGLGLGVSLAWVLFAFGEFGEEVNASDFIIPWRDLLVICTIAFGSSMLMTFLPARAASRVPVAEALRYE